MARRWPRRDGPLAGPLGDPAATLHVLSAMEHGIRTVIDTHQRVMPDIVRIAGELTAADLRALSLPEALDQVPLRR